jgi:hypothetical protein
MSDPLPRDHPDYRHPQATAPPDVIMDADDLAEMRDKLRAGHNVVIGPTGHVLVSAEPVGPPMTAEAEAFIESRLGEVRRLALEGVSTRISPDGNMAGSGASGQVQHAMGPDKAFTADELGMVENAIMAGHRVSIRPDGSIFTAHYPNDRVTTIEERQELLVTFNRMRSSGDFQKTLDGGEAVQVFVDKVVHGRLEQPLPPPIEFPEPGTVTPSPDGTGEDGSEGEPARPLPSAAELKAEADRLTAEAAGIRKDGEGRVYDEVVTFGRERDAVARQKYGAEQQAAAADQQVKREQRLADEHRKTAETAEKAARELAAKGDDIGAAEKTEEAREARNLSEASALRAVSARDEGVKLRHQADDLGRKLNDYESAIERAKGRSWSVDNAADGREDRARHLGSASHNLSESERLMAEAAKMRAEGDAEAAQLTENAANYHRKLAAEDWAKAEEVPIAPTDNLDDPTQLDLPRKPPPVFGMDDPVNPSSDQVAAVEPAGSGDLGDVVGADGDITGADGEAVLEPTAVASLDGSADPDHIEMPEMDLSGSSEVDAAAALSGDLTAVAAPVDPPDDPGTMWPDEAVATAEPPVDDGLADDPLA